MHRNSCTVVHLPPDDVDGAAPVTGYLLQRRSPGMEWMELNKTPVRGLKHVVRHLVPRTQYQFRVAAVNKFDEGDFSDASDLIMTNVTSVPDQPRPPFVVKLVGTSVTLQWTAPDDGGEVITGYVVRSGVPGTDVFKYDTAHFDGQTTTSTLTKLKPNTKYQFAVSAVNKIDRGPFSAFSEYILTYKYSGTSYK